MGTDSLFFLRFFSLSLPFFIALTGIVIVSTAYFNSFRYAVRTYNRLLLFLLLSLSGTWIGLFLYYLIPDCFAVFFPFYAFAVVSIPVCLYIYIYILYTAITIVETKKKVLKHFITPIMIAVMAAVFPYLSDEISDSSGASRLSVTSLLFSITYAVPTIRLIWRYHHEKHTIERMNPTAYRQTVTLVAMMCIQLINAILMVNKRLEGHASGIYMMTVAVLISVLMGVLLYNAISRDFAGRKEKYGANVKKIIKQGKANSVNMKKEKLSRRLFENIVIKDKVFLHPRLSLVELASLLKTDRNALSAFVNAEYGMNFNRYINSLRLSEFERLQNMPENKNAKSGELAVMSGFGNYHCYLRERKVKEKNEVGIAKVKEKETKRKGTDANN